MADATAAPRYDRPTIALHWTVAALVALLWALGQLTGTFDKPLGDLILSAHIVIGVLLVLVLAIRVAWRLTGGRRLAEPGSRLMRLLAVTVHYVLYILVAAALLLGLYVEWARGDSIFGLFALPAPTSLAPLGDNTREIRHQIIKLHGLVANWIVILAAMHAAAALFHQYVLRDGVLSRMLPRRARS